MMAVGHLPELPEVDLVMGGACCEAEICPSHVKSISDLTEVAFLASLEQLAP